MHKNVSYKTWVEIDQKALIANVATTQKLIGTRVAMMAVIKANAYGHGILEIARILSKNIKLNALWFGVDSIEEALLLKHAGINKPIMILGYIPEPCLIVALQNNFHISIYSQEVLSAVHSILKKYHHRVAPHLHLKIETGTNRLGMTMPELVRIQTFPVIEGIYTHFAETENTASRYYQQQLAVFSEAKNILEKKNMQIHFFHTAATAATFQYPETHGNLVRLGIGLYGLWPSKDVQRANKRILLQPVLTWKTRIVQIKTVKYGETVGYDRAWKAKRNSQIAILPIGYYDGYDRRLSGNGVVLVGGKRAPVIGRVCMNMCMIDVSNISKIAAGDEVVLLGKQGKEEISADEIARRIGSIHYEVVSRINPLIARVII